MPSPPRKPTLPTLQPRVRTLGTPLAERKANPTGRTADPRRAIPLNSARWQRLREQVLARDPLCRMCNAPATDVDHISGDPSDNTPANLQGLCHACHSYKTGRERAGLPVRAIGCDVNGWPLDPAHPWNAEKSPATDAR